MLKVCWGLRVEMRSGISADLDLNTHGRKNTRISRCAWFCCSNWRGQRDRRSWTWKQGARGKRWVCVLLWWLRYAWCAVSIYSTVCSPVQSPRLIFLYVGPYELFLLKVIIMCLSCLLCVVGKKKYIHRRSWSEQTRYEAELNLNCLSMLARGLWLFFYGSNSITI